MRKEAAEEKKPQSYRITLKLQIKKPHVFVKNYKHLTMLKLFFFNA